MPPKKKAAAKPKKAAKAKAVPVKAEPEATMITTDFVAGHLWSL